MKELKIHSTPKTPKIDFNPTSGVFLVSGVSVPENSIEFYGEIIKWLKEYVKTPPKKTKMAPTGAFFVSASNTVYLFIIAIIEKKLVLKRTDLSRCSR